MSTTLSTPELPAVGFVADLSPSDRALLSSYGEFKAFEAQQTVIRQGQAQDSLYFVVSGLLHARRTDGERELLVGRINQGEWFGEVNIFDPADASATVVAVQYTQVWRIGREDLNAFIQQNQFPGIQIVVGIAIVLSKRIRSMGDKLLEKAQFDEIYTALQGHQAAK